MSVLINTRKWHVEFEINHLWVTNRKTGMTLGMRGAGLAKQVRDCLKTHDPDRVAETFSRILGPDAPWFPIFKKLPDLPAELEEAA